MTDTPGAITERASNAIPLDQSTSDDQRRGSPQPTPESMARGFQPEKRVVFGIPVYNQEVAIGSFVLACEGRFSGEVGQ